MVLVVRAQFGDAITYTYEPRTNTIEFVATPMPMPVVFDQHLFGSMEKLWRLGKATEMTVLDDDFATAVARRYELRFWPASPPPNGWISERASMGGTRHEVTVLQIKRGAVCDRNERA